MSVATRITFLFLTMLAIVFLPALGAWFYYDGVFPENFFAYPPLTAMHKDSYFNLYIFIVVALVCAAMTAVYIFPGWFGFKKPVIQAASGRIKKRLPIWFWIGLVAWGIAMIFFLQKDKNPAWFIHWSDLPLFWGMVLMLDGWVYLRNNGESLVSHYTQELIGIGVASVSGWMIFEFMNFFVDDNWYYPFGYILDREEFLLYACIISSGLLPLAFEWYCVFKTYPKLSRRFSNGVKLIVPEQVKNVLLVLGLAGMALTGLFPDYLFFTLWVAPPVILGIVLDKIGRWTPFKSVGQGNWSPILLSALTYFVAGLTLECQNYFSASHNPLWTEDPAYWQYSLPYVNVLHVFEMPLLGLFGYLPFGIYCWVWWISVAVLLNIPARFLSENPLQFRE